MKKNLLIILALAAVGTACLPSGVKSLSPLSGYYITQANGLFPIAGVMHDVRGEYSLTNWVAVTNDSYPKIVTVYLKPSIESTATAGQVWVNSFGCYINTPKVTVHRAETNEMWSIPEWRSTNDWPELAHHAELIYVYSIEKAGAGEVKGRDYYARCRVRMWSGTTAYTESDSTLLLSYLTNTATLLREPSR